MSELPAPPSLIPVVLTRSLPLPETLNELPAPIATPPLSVVGPPPATVSVAAAGMVMLPLTVNWSPLALELESIVAPPLPIVIGPA